jgi:transcriptional regulator with XRE-family HTH domain
MANFTYKSYSFKDKDPIIDEIRTVYQESGATYKWVSDASGVTSTTLNNWFKGKTKKPQAATINAVLRALGYKLAVVQYGEKPQVVTMVESKPYSKETRHAVQMAKYKK